MLCVDVARRVREEEL